MTARFSVRHFFFFCKAHYCGESCMRTARTHPGREARLTDHGSRTTLIILAVAWAARALAILLFSSCAEATAMARCTAGAAPPLPLVSVIIPCHNAMPWLDACLASCATQDYEGPLEVSIFDDSSTDGSDACIRAWAGRLEDAGVRCVCSGNRWPGSDGNGVTDPTAPAGGAGRARNKAVAQSSGSFLCFLDADDVMLPGRVRRQLAAAREHPCAIIGGGFVKEPPGATEHYAKWYAARNAGIHAFVSAERWWSIPDATNALPFDESLPACRCLQGEWPDGRAAVAAALPRADRAHAHLVLFACRLRSRRSLR